MQRRIAAIVAVAVVHLLLIGLWLQVRQPNRPTMPPQPALQVVLLPRLAPAPAAPEIATRWPTERAQRRLAAPPAAPSLTWVPPAAAERAPAAVTITAEPAPATAPTIPSPAPLNLALPRAASAPWRANESLRPPLRTAPRPGTAEASVGRLTQNDGAVQEASLGDGRVRLRGRGACVEAHEARSTQIDPFNRSVQPVPRQVTACLGDPPPRKD